jgi:hypothetical protein
MKEFGLQSAIRALHAAERAGGGKASLHQVPRRSTAIGADSGTADMRTNWQCNSSTMPAVDTPHGSVRSGSVFAAGANPLDTKLVWS